MKILVADENVDWELIDQLRNRDFEVLSIFEDHRGITDLEVVDVAVAADAIILTEDKDFGELAYRLGVRTRGVILARLTSLTRPDRISTVISVVEQHGDQLYNKFTVITPNKIRIRNLGE